ncbi:MAG: isopropanol dehydrogenase [Thermovirga sp.]|jgi:hypothetical protein|nr:isopropanol dehydrogenase [Thermovirga sp.]
MSHVIVMFTKYECIPHQEPLKGGNIMKGFAMLSIGNVGWIEKEAPKPGPFDAIVKPLAVAPCTSDIHTVFEGAIGERHNMILDTKQ